MNYVQEIYSDKYMGVPQAECKETIVLDYGNPNVAKPLHVGHLRSAIIGEALKRIITATGRTAIGDVHLGDWGLPMGLVLAELEERYLTLSEESKINNNGWQPEKYLVNAVKSGDKMNIKVAISLYIDKNTTDSDQWNKVISYINDNDCDFIWETHKEIEPMKPKSEWNVDYLGLLQSDLMHNFSKKRLRQIIKVMNHVYK